MSTENISQRFLDGLQQYNLTISEIQESGWKYAGGDTEGGPLNYFQLIFHADPINIYPLFHEGAPIPDKCICGKSIERHYFITNTDNSNLLCIGSECIKRFLPENLQRRVCTLCMNSHKRTKNTICFPCEEQIKEEKKKLCVDCGKTKQYPQYDRCRDCYYYIKRTT